jgi:predicted HTH transcriptional regulator
MQELGTQIARRNAMTDEQFAELLQLEHELSGIEFKPPGLRTEKTLFHVVARAVMGMANRRDGGRVVIGVREDSGRFELVGLSSAEIESWRYDHFTEALAPVADPPVAFNVELHQYLSLEFLLIDIHEFDDVPVICRRNFPHPLKAGQKPILRDGAIYVRTRRKPETTEIPTQTEMRDLIDLATEKRLRNLMGTVSRAGGRLESESSAEDAFIAELPEDLR